MIYLCIPAYNECDNLKRLFPGIQGLMDGLQEVYQIVLVDDGSSDGTADFVQESAKQLPIQTIVHPQNMGVHKAFEHIYEYIDQNAKEGDLAVTLEADNTSDLNILPQMLELAKTSADLVLASCYAPGGAVQGTNLFRKICSFAANGLLRIFLPMPNVHTYSSFYRVYRASLLKQCVQAYGQNLIVQQGFVCVVELLAKMSLLGAKVCEVPMVLKGDERQGQSKMKVWRTMLSYFALMKHYVFCRDHYVR